MHEKRRGILPCIKVGFAAAGIAICMGILFSCFTGTLVISLERMDTPVLLKPPPFLVGNETSVKSEPVSLRQPTPVTRLGFLKVEKASSSTLSGIFFRFGVRHNLTFGLPKDELVIYSDKELLTKNRDGKFDILAVHVAGKALFDRLLSDKHEKIGIIRDPLKRMISAAYFFRDLATKNKRENYLQKIPKETFIHSLINEPDLYEDDMNFTLTRNHMGKCFGFLPNTSYYDNDVIRRHLMDLNKQFKLVLVTERLEESLVLMKRLLNWSLNDIIYLSKNVHSHEKVDVTRPEVEKFRRASFIDYAIYNYFSAILDQKILSQGISFKDEVKHFQDVLRKISKFCESKSLKPMKIGPSSWNKPFTLFRNDCKLMGDGNPAIIANLRIRTSAKFGNRRQSP